jgi:glycosyltransferase involved in cell wall biosynthesis
MRIAVFTNRFFARDLHALADAGIAVELFAIRPDQRRRAVASPVERRRTGVPVHHLSLRDSARHAAPLVRRHPMPLLREGGALLATAARRGMGSLARTAYVLPKAWAWAAAEGERFDHVLAYRGDHVGSCAMAFHRLLPRPVPFTIWVHTHGDLQARAADLRRKLLHADNVITCCETNRELLRRRLPDLGGAVEGKIHVCHHGLDLGEHPYEPEGRTGHHLLSVGRLDGDAGVDGLLRAVFLLRIRGIDVTLDVLGDGPQRHRLRTVAGLFGLDDRVRWLGRRSPADTRQAVRTATLLAVPASRTAEGLPASVREAMALGTPVVASRGGAMSEALAGDCGALVPPRDDAALADAIARLLSDAGARRRIAARARRRAEERFDAGKNGVRLGELRRGSRRPGPLAAAAC